MNYKQLFLMCVMIQYETNIKSVQRRNKLTSHIDFVLIFYKPKRVLLNVLLRKRQCPKTLLKLSLIIAKQRPMVQ